MLSAWRIAKMDGSPKRPVQYFVTRLSVCPSHLGATVWPSLRHCMRRHRPVHAVASSPVGPAKALEYERWVNDVLRNDLRRAVEVKARQQQEVDELDGLEKSLKELQEARDVCQGLYQRS